MHKCLFHPEDDPQNSSSIIKQWQRDKFLMEDKGRTSVEAHIYVLKGGGGEKEGIKTQRMSKNTFSINISHQEHMKKDLHYLPLVVECKKWLVGLYSFLCFRAQAREF